MLVTPATSSCVAYAWRKLISIYIPGSLAPLFLLSCGRIVSPRSCCGQGCDNTLVCWSEERSCHLLKVLDNLRADYAVEDTASELDGLAGLAISWQCRPHLEQFSVSILDEVFSNVSVFSTTIAPKRSYMPRLGTMLRFVVQCCSVSWCDGQFQGRGSRLELSLLREMYTSVPCPSIEISRRSPPLGVSRVHFCILTSSGRTGARGEDRSRNLPWVL